MPRLRRFLLILTFAVWQGGFVFYAGVVVPTGTELHGHFGQGRVTQRVTNALNLLGLLAHAAYLWELLAAPGRKRLNWVLWGISLMMLGGLAAVHPVMDSLIGPTGVEGDFPNWHKLYLWLSTAQWAVAVVLLWRAVKTAPARTPPGPPAVH